MVSNDEITGLTFAFLAALSFGSYGVPMKGEAATRVNVDPLVFQSYKAFTVFATSTVLIWVNNFLADRNNSLTDDDVSNTNDGDYWTFQKWTFADFTPWAFVSALMWVPGGTAGVYAIRRAGLAISVGIWSCVIVMLSFCWGVLIFHEKQKSGVWGAVWAMSVLCIGLFGIAYFSSEEPKSKNNNHDGSHEKSTTACETTPLVDREKKLYSDGDDDDGNIDEPLDFEAFPHCGAPPHSHQTIHLKFSSFTTNKNKSGKDDPYFTLDIPKYHLGILMAILNGVLAATIMVPLHYAPSNTTHGVGYSMSFGLAAVIVVIASWFLRFSFNAVRLFVNNPQWNEQNGLGKDSRRNKLQKIMQIFYESCSEGFGGLPSFHIKDMWRPGLLAGLLYSMGNLCGIVSIQKLGNFMGYSLNQTSMIISGLWGIFYYREIPGVWNMIGFLTSACVVMMGILLLGREHVS